MQVHGPSQVHGPHDLKGPHTNQRTAGSKPVSAAGPSDSLDISPAARAAAEAAETGGVRSDLVARVRNEIASGTYETPEKLDSALNNLLDEIS
jgi:negative regulator of flagellin synthesis FlgM